MKDIKELTEDMMGKMRTVIEDGDDALPIIFRVDKDDHIDVIGIPMEEDKKDVVAMVLRKVATMPSTSCVLFLCDAWIAEGEGEELETSRNQYKQVRYMPGRREAITCSVMGVGVTSMHASWKYDRDTNNKPIFEDKIEWVGGEGSVVSGRFAPDLSGGAKA